MREHGEKTKATDYRQAVPTQDRDGWSGGGAPESILVDRRPRACRGECSATRGVDRTGTLRRTIQVRGRMRTEVFTLWREENKVRARRHFC
jgi:hypothetical protein